MRLPRVLIIVFFFTGILIGDQTSVRAQCCLSGLFSGCGCFKTAVPAYAVAPVPAPPPVVPVVAPAVVAAPAPPPQPVMVPTQQVSYVPETTYQTQYQCVPVTCYRPSCEIDPCTGCPVECMEQVTNYVQKAVSVPVTQYRAVYTTKYVQVQPGAGVTPAVGTVPGVAASPFATPSQTTPQAWGAAGSAASPSVPTQQPVLPPAAPSSTYQQQIVPQSGNYAPTQQNPLQMQPTSPPALTPAPSLKPIPELSRDSSASQSPNFGATVPANPNTSGNSDPSSNGSSQPNQPQKMIPPTIVPSPSLRPIPPATNSSTSNTQNSYGTPLRGNSDMPVLPGNGPTTSTRAFPKLLEPTGHTTSWKPASQKMPFQPSNVQNQNSWQPAFTKVPSGAYAQGWQSTYPTAALPKTAQ